MTKVYSIEEVAEMIGVSTRTVRRLISSRALTAAQIGRQWRITHRDLDAYFRGRGSLGLGPAPTTNPVEDGPDGEMWADAA